MYKLDHVVVHVHELTSAAADFSALGFTVFPGGRHANGSTHNALICFRDGTYIELLAPTGEPPQPAPIDFSRMTHGGEGFAGFALITDNIEQSRHGLTAQGLRVAEIVEGGRRRNDGVELRWKLALIEDDFMPFLIEDVTPRTLRVPSDDERVTHANGAVGITQLSIPLHASRLSQRLGKLLGDSSAEWFDLGSCTLVLPDANSAGNSASPQLTIAIRTSAQPLNDVDSHGVRLKAAD